MHYQVLGPLSASVDGESVNLGGPKQRLVLALLLMEAGRTVSADRLIDRIWDDEPPERARHTLQAYISELRKLLEDPIEWTGNAYRLVVDMDRIDSARFERLLEAGRRLLESDPSLAALTLKEALDLWTGRPYEDLAYASATRTEISRLEELRLVALELRIEADLRLGRQSEILAELDSLTAEYPLREKFRAQQMLALYRSGRQAEALRAFARLRQTLADELGIDPSPELQGLEEQLLSQDRSLDLLPTAEPELVFLFTDLEGSTALWETHPEDMDAAVAAHHDAVYASIDTRGGLVFKTTGDGVLAVMPAVDAAVQAASQIQQELTGRRWGAIEDLSTRVAIDLGPVRERAGDYFGPTLNRCARLLGVAHGGQVLLSMSAAEAVSVTGDTRVIDLGERRLRGIGSPQRIFQLVAPGLPSSFPPLRSDGSSRVLSTIGFEATTIRGYELRDRIGEGDFGVVYRAYQTSVGREVAVKAIRPEYSNRPTFVRRFEAEAQFVAELEHPHIVSLYDYWRDPDGAYLVMPYMRGGSLGQALQRGPWNAGPALRLLDQVGAALSYAHRKGVIHRDLKPANVLLDEDGNAYLSDFGISAHLTDKAGAPLTSSLTYVPPEELRGESLTPESDIFCLAVLTFELFSGTRLTGRGRLPSITGIRADLPVELADVLMVATDDRPGQRPDRVEDFLRAVRQAIGADVVGVVHEEAGPSSPAPIRNPYKGLRAFQETDAADFHGREGLMDELLEAVLHHRLVAVVGPSGGGKSSVVRAALLPALRAGALPESRGWLITDMFPGSYPFEELEAALLRVAVDDPGALLDELRSDDRGLMRIIKRILPTDDTELVLVIDQFEEMFSMVEDEETRNLFLGALTTLVNDERGRIRVIITLRADFFDRPLQYASFGQLVKDGLVSVVPPTDEGLSLAISRPARSVGLDLEPGLVGEIVSDVHGQPGGLPLLQYALTELFQRRQGSELTIDAYRRTGGVLGALGRRAEEIFSGLPTIGQEAAQQLFLRLVTVDEDTDDTRRRVRLSELRGLALDQAALESVLQQFGSYRLLTFDRDPLTRSPTVEVAHEALLSGWDRLRAWIAEQRDELILHRRLAAAHHEWAQAGGQAAFLLTGGRLEQFEVWTANSSMALTGDERQYLVTSRVEENRRGRRRTVGRWSIVGVLAAATVVIGLLALTANDQARLATVRELSAASIAKIEAEPELAILLALQAAETSRSAGEPALPETLDALHRAVQATRIVGRIPGSWFVEYSPNGELMVVASGSDAAIWNVTREEMIRILPSPGGQAGGAAFSTDGSLLAVGYTGGEAAVVLWDVATGERLSQMRGPLWPFPVVAFSPDGRLVAAAGDGFPAVVWKVADGSERYQIGTTATDIAFAPDGSTLALADYERGVTLHDPETGAETDFIEDTAFNPVGIAFDPSGSRLAAVQQPGQEARIFDLDTRKFLSISIQSPVGHAWSPDGRWLALGSFAGNPRLYDTETGNEVMVLPGPSSGWLAFSPDGRQLASAGEGDTLVWDVTPAGNREVGTLHLPDLSPDVAMFGTGVDEILVAREVCPPTCPATLGGPATQVSRGPVALINASGQQVARGPAAFVTWPLVASSKAGLLGITDSKCLGEILDTGTLEHAYDLPAGMYAQAISPDGTRVLLDLIGPDCPAEYTQPIVVEYPSGRLLARLPGGPLFPGGYLFGAYLSPDGQLAVATPYDTNKTYLYDVEAGQVLFTFDSEYFVFDFSPDGQQLAATTTGGTLTVFDVAALRGGGSEGQGLNWTIAAHVPVIPHVQYTPDGSAIVTGGRNDGLVRVWDAATGERIAEFVTNRATDRLPFFDISSDGRHIIALGGDDTLRVYTLDTDELIQIARERVTRSFTEEECRAYLHLESCPAS